MTGRMPAHDPELPAFDEMSAVELHRVIGGPLRCARCGAELELRCGNGHLHTAAPTKSPNVPARVIREVDRQGRRCTAGHELPPRKSRCLICRPIARPLTRRSPGPRAGPLTFRPKRCACGQRFTPTGPNAKRCKRCRGAIARQKKNTPATRTTRRTA